MLCDTSVICPVILVEPQLMMWPWISGTPAKIERTSAWKTWSIGCELKLWSLKVCCSASSPIRAGLLYLLSDEWCISKCFASHLLLFRWVCSEWANVRPPDRFLCALPAAGVSPRQTLCAGRLRSTRPGDRRSYAGWSGQGNALCPQRGKAVLSPGMQVHTPADQLLSPVEGGADRETRRRCEIALPAHLHTEPQRRCVVSALLYVRPTHTDTQIQNVSVQAPQRRPGSRSDLAAEGKADMSSVRQSACAVWHLLHTCLVPNLTVSRLRIEEDGIRVCKIFIFIHSFIHFWRRGTVHCLHAVIYIQKKRSRRRTDTQ